MRLLALPVLFWPPLLHAEEIVAQAHGAISCSDGLGSCLLLHASSLSSPSELALRRTRRAPRSYTDATGFRGPQSTQRRSG